VVEQTVRYRSFLLTDWPEFGPTPHGEIPWLVRRQVRTPSEPGLGTPQIRLGPEILAAAVGRVHPATLREPPSSDRPTAIRA
jgi:hypothetical protein